MTTDLDLIALDTSDRFVFDAHNAFLTARMTPIGHRVRMTFTNGDIHPTPERRREIALLAHAAANTLRSRLPWPIRVRPLYPRSARLTIAAGPTGMTRPIVLDAADTGFRVWTPLLRQTAWIAGYAALLDGMASRLEDDDAL